MQKKEKEDSKSNEQNVASMPKTWVIVDGLPELRENQDHMKFSTALQGAADKVAQHGSKKRPTVYIPFDTIETRHSKDSVIDGCALIAFGSEKDALVFSKRYAAIDDLKLFRNTLRVYNHRDMHKFEQVPDEHKKLTREEFQDQRNLLWWLQDTDNEAYRDQYVVRFTGPEFDETYVYWMDENQTKTGRSLCYDATELKEQSKSLTDQYVEWSPNGCYLVSTHKQGVQLWAGPQWMNFHKLEHHKVDKISFSPKETFLITCNEQPYTPQNGQKQPPSVRIWDVLTGDLLITAPAKTIGPAIKLKLPGWWPVFKWSYDEQYMAKINSSKGMSAKPKDLDKINLFHVREKTEEEIKQSEESGGDSSRFQIAKLQGKLAVDSLFNLEFSPTDNVLAYTTFAQNDDQAKVSLISVPSKNTLRVQTLGFDVKKAHLYWQSQGRYLAINMAHSHSKATIAIKTHTIGILTVKERNMPFSRTKQLGMVTYFAWEPEGSRYAVIHGGTKRENPHVSVFQVQDATGRVDKGASRLKLMLSRRKCNNLLWAPNGGRLVVAQIDPERRAGGELEFVDLNKIQNANDDSSTVKNKLHECMTDIAWDPSGRFLMTATTQRLHTSSGDDTRYTIWSFQGEQLFTHKLKSFYQILWRPRPRDLEKLAKSDKQSINKKRSGGGWDRQFKQTDDRIRMATENKKLLENQEKYNRYVQRKEAMQSMSRQILAKREGLRGHVHDDYSTRTVQQKLEKGRPITYVINKDTMRKILNEEIADFNAWWQENRQ
eukprot:CAMPEP_0197037490 /NCGR_PEP_ID=MMETSP1384-20130603/14690_1 /TAXON_ID=29189 /ORGANISM="Ammonia sp." /LENGTH=770 /DNA_ID=CAMNT_0042467801 /DNA_START=80 /DNA_END=2392 /DNA_ORIENTATION=-